MKKLFLIALAALPLLFASCGSDNEAAEQRADSLQGVIEQKDEEIASLFEVLGDIENNMTEIASRYSQVNSLRMNNPEKNNKVKGEITDQLAIIDNILAQNKQKIAQLNSKISALGAENQQLQGLVESLNTRIEQQEEQINSLLEELTISKETINRLSANVSDLTRSNREKDAMLDQKSQEALYNADQTHKAYYVVGTKDVLLDEGILTEEGGLLFKQKKASRNVNANKFNLIDRFKVTTIDVNLRKAELKSDHPKGSYEWVMDENDKKVTRQLVIKDVDEFWKNTDFLIICGK